MSDERQKAKEAILKRRAKLIALAMTGVGWGNACGGKTEGANNSSGSGSGDGEVQQPDYCLGAPDYCLSICLQPDYCLSAPCDENHVRGYCDPYGSGGNLPCLTLCEHYDEQGVCHPGLGGAGLGGAGEAAPTGGTGDDEARCAPVFPSVRSAALRSIQWASESPSGGCQYARSRFTMPRLGPGRSETFRASEPPN